MSMDPVEEGLVPFWVAIDNRAPGVLDRRRVPRHVRGPYEASRHIPAPLSHVLTSTIYWCGNRPLLLLATPEITLDLDIVGSWFGIPIRPAQPTEVSVLAGSDLTAVPPAGLAAMMPVFMDDSILELSSIWVPAADPTLWLSLAPERLVRASGAFPVPIRAGAVPRRPEYIAH
jgi:prolyl-tRNA editing enzyme YbaK/EbsC (Cys-tRNA(Pro) deacylase)